MVRILKLRLISSWNTRGSRRLFGGSNESQIQDRLRQAKSGIAVLSHELTSLKSKISKLEAQSNLWSDSRKSKEMYRAKSEIEDIETLTKSFDEVDELWQLMPDGIDDISQYLEEIESALDQRERDRVFEGDLDDCSAFVTVIAGAGGNDARNFVGIVARMYQVWGFSMNWHVEVVDSSYDDGEDMTRHIAPDALFRSITLKVNGFRAFGHFRAEAGSHRLVRVSPFSAQGKRHTAFAAVTVYPSVDDDDSERRLPLDANDVNIDTFKSSGAGGQHVNTTNSAVRVTHLPTGITVKCQNQRSQHQNKATALQLLEARITALKQEEKETARRASMKGGESGVATFGGSHIRSYIMHPYQLVKCHRTGWQSGDVEGFLSGSCKLKECVFEVLKLQARK